MTIALDSAKSFSTNLRSVVVNVDPAADNPVTWEMSLPLKDQLGTLIDASVHAGFQQVQLAFLVNDQNGVPQSLTDISGLLTVTYTWAPANTLVIHFSMTSPPKAGTWQLFVEYVQPATGNVFMLVRAPVTFQM